MPPALRKKCSFLTAVPDTGKMSVMLSILPAGMVKNHKVIRLKTPCDEQPAAAYREVAERFLGLSSHQRETLLNLIDTICFEKSANVSDPYDPKKFLRCYTAIAQRDEETLFEMILTSVERVRILSNLPNSITEKMKALYCDYNYLSKVINFSSLDVFEPEKFFEKFKIQIETEYLLDSTMEILNDTVMQVGEGIRIKNENWTELDEKVRKTMELLPSLMNDSNAHKVYLTSIAEALKAIRTRLDIFKETVYRIKADCKNKVRKRNEILSKSNPYFGQLITSYLESNAADARTYNLDFSSAFRIVVSKVFDETNAELMNNNNNPYMVKYDDIYMNECIEHLRIAINNGDVAKAAELIETAFQFSERNPRYQENFDFLLANYACVIFTMDEKAFSFIDRLHEIRQKYFERNKKIFYTILEQNYRAAVQYCFDYTDGYDETYIRLITLLGMCTRYDEQTMDQEEFNRMCGRIRSRLTALGEKTYPDERTGEAGDHWERVSAKVFKSKRGTAFYNCIYNCWKMDQPGKKKKGRGSPLPKKLLIGAAGVAGIALIVAIVILLVNVIGGKGNETSGGETTSETQMVQETNVTETSISETDIAETNAPETNAPETGAPETGAPETNAPETNAPETNAPETGAPETGATV